MKNPITMAFVVLALACSCSDKNKNSATAAKPDYSDTEKDSTAIDRDREVTVNDTIEWRGKTYYAELHRFPIDSTRIIDESGDIYSDNYITLKIMSDGNVFYEHLFKKSTFRGHMPEEFYKKYRLNGLVFEKITDEGLKFAASVGNPSQEDEYIPFSVTISAGGSMSITKDNNLDTSAPSDEED